MDEGKILQKEMNRGNLWNVQWSISLEYSDQYVLDQYIKKRIKCFKREG